ncbi:energy-coupling factor transporter transmembrane component T family protein [Paracoccus aestuariivivens]|uniref:Energy-coupling factor transporter transmembrane protein EcfT n=1 Tax=Paracoccus aestuariivivens TaxID=1820333 RepID=A0A6L6JDA5_9RHOB|nr:energy-coupling factor transporter transmembrane protein EcfT [Paracoccus aestuariivivens]MTH78134.1 energy-coupling factor transporter transmembrane protein EcfT [Paracoccus aestuariivivens]
MISLTSPVKTRAHNWPAGLKLLGLAATTTLLFLIPGIRFQAAALVSVLALYTIPGRHFLHHGLRQLRVIWPFVALLLVWHAIAGNWPEGIRTALRMTSAVAIANLVTMTTSLGDMTDLLHRLFRPLRRTGLPFGIIEIAIPLVIRFTPVLIGKGRLLLDAWRARSPRRANWHIVLPMALLALDDADHLAEALRARGGLNPRDED